MISPLFVYSVVWVTVIFLQSLHVLDFYEPVSMAFLWIQVLMITVLFISEALFKIFFQETSKVIINYSGQLVKLGSMVDKLFPLLIFMFVVDTIYSGGFPLFWVITGDIRTHVDFGMPTFHGAFHGILLFFTTTAFLLARVRYNLRRNMLYIAFFIAYVIVAFNRGIFVIFAVQATFITLILFRRIKLINILYAVVFFVLAIWLFGVLGDYRMGDNVFEKSASREWFVFFEVFPTNLLWFYSYASGGLNNLYANIPFVDPSYVPQYTFAKLVPTVVYDLLGTPKAYDTFTLADARLTVSTAFQGLVSDFGLIGILLYLPVIFMAQLQYRKAKKRSYRAVLFYGMLMQTIVMTPYIDTVFYLTFLLQFFLVFSCFFVSKKNVKCAT